MFKERHSLEQRKTEASRIRTKYPNRIPVIVSFGSNVPGLTGQEKEKYLVPNDQTVGQFAYTIRNRIKLDPETALFIFVNNTLPANSASLGLIYDQNKDDDGFLYLHFNGESTFGSGLFV